MARIIRRKGGLEEELHHRSGLQVLTKLDEPFDCKDPEVAADLVLDGTARFEVDANDLETVQAVAQLQSARAAAAAAANQGDAPVDDPEEGQ